MSAFKDYATRVSFNITLSRNQAYALWAIAVRQPHEPLGNMRTIGSVADNFVVGARKLQSIGLVKWEDPTLMKPRPWCRDPFTLTKAGEHVLALLQLAGVIPHVAVNENSRRRRA